MSTKVRQYLYTAEDIYGKDALDEGMSRDEIWHSYEAALAEDAELIQHLVDALDWVAAYDNGCPLPTWEKGYNNAWSIANSARAAAAAAGFKPSDQ